MIAANDVSDTSIGFNSDHNAMTLFWQDASGTLQQHALERASKARIAEQILRQLTELQSQYESHCK